jgi:peptide/nickel transport system permease protein
LLRYLLRRVLFFVPVWLGVATAVFLLVRLSGDPAVAILGDKAPPAEIEEFRAREGLDRPLPAQYAAFLWDTVRGDLGRSYRTNRPVATDLAEYFPATVELTLLAMLLAVGFGVGLGTLAAVNRNGPVDGASMVTALVGVSVPVFWLALLAMKALGEEAGLFPVGGRLSAGTEFRPLTGIYTLDALLRGDLDALSDAVGHLVLPACVLATVPSAIVTRMTRSTLVETLGKDHVRTARAKGLPARTVVVRHALRNSLVPIVTVIGLHFGLLLGGAVLTETVFGWPGLGKYTVDSVMRRDFHAVQGALLLMATTFVLVNLAVDVLYGFLDPRIRESYEEGR